MTITIAPIDFRDYAKAHGWTQIDEALKDRLYVMENESFPRRQLIFPMDTSAPDYSDAIRDAAEKFAELYRRDIREIIGEASAVRDDTMRFRVRTLRSKDPSLPLPYAASLLSGAQQLLMSSACSVLKPRAHHPRLSKVEAQQLMEAARFGHTEEGSFVLKVSCPINAVDVNAPLPFSDEIGGPFVRRATLALISGLNQLVSAIEGDKVENLIEQTRSSERPILSSNFCEAVTKLYDEETTESLDISVAWAASHPVAFSERRSIVRIHSNYFQIIEQVRRELRSSDAPTEDTYVGTVERLDGDLDEDGRRAGEVILSLLLEGESVRVRASLSADEYDKADKAHMRHGAYVQITGRLHPGRQPRALTDVSQFDLIGVQGDTQAS